LGRTKEGKRERNRELKKKMEASPEMWRKSEERGGGDSKETSDFPGDSRHPAKKGDHSMKKEGKKDERIDRKERGGRQVSPEGTLKGEKEGVGKSELPSTLLQKRRPSRGREGDNNNNREPDKGGGSGSSDLHMRSKRRRMEWP